ncbi:MAG: alpha/beta fold hydrolase [Dehalococcoidia bacterium]
MPVFGAPGERIGYELYSHPDGAPPLVLIHGFTASKSSFEVNLAGLREHFTVITVELLGHGSSDAPEDAVFYRPERAIRRLLQFFDHLGYDRVLLCGHSLGGALALRLALDAPEWVAGLVVINSSSAAGTPEWREAARPRMEEMAARVRAEGTGFMKETRLYPAHSKRLDPLSKELLTRDFDRLQPAGVAGTAESLVIDVNAWERHPSLAVPMLLVVGERDADFAPNAAAFLARFPQDMVREVDLPAAGHAANIEQPEEFNGAVVDFAHEIGYLRKPAVEGNRVLTALGGALVVAGLGLLAAAVFLNGNSGDGNTQLLAAAPDATQSAGGTPTQVAQVAGTSAAGPTRPAAVDTSTRAATATAPAAASPTTAPPTQAPATQPAATATPRPATATPVVAQATAIPTATPAPTETPTPAATATPSGPYAAIAGPSTGEVGSAVVFTDASFPAALTRTWVTPAGTENASPGVSFTPSAPGCYVVSMTAYFKTGQVLTTTHAVSVGGVSCGGGQG